MKQVSDPPASPPSPHEEPVSVTSSVENKCGSHQSYHMPDMHHAAAVGIISMGCDLLSARRYSPAMETLADAVDLLRRPPAEHTIRDDDDDDESLREYVESNKDATVRAEERALRQLLALEIERNTEKKEKMPEEFDDDGAPFARSNGSSGPLFIYERPFCPSSTPAGNASGNFLLEEVAAVALYNLALAYHLAASDAASPSCATRRPCHARLLTDKALALYQMCESVLLLAVEKMQALSSPYETLLGPDGVDLLTMALLNNMGAAGFETGHAGLGWECIDGLRCVLAEHKVGASLELIADAATALPDTSVFEINVAVASQIFGAPAA